ncbi:hypothetical protein AVEN_128391-1, partial [Araneus ventricosus]
LFLTCEPAARERKPRLHLQTSSLRTKTPAHTCKHLDSSGLRIENPIHTFKPNALLWFASRKARPHLQTSWSLTVREPKTPST